MKRCSWFIHLIVFAIVFLTGCIETNIIDELSLVHGVAYDKGEGEKKEISISFPNFIEQGEESTLFSQSLSESAMTTRGALNLIGVKTQKPIKLGQSRSFVFSNSIAEEGIEHLVDSLYRNPSVPNRVQLAVADGRAEKVYRVAQKDNDRIGVFIPDLIEHVQMESIPPSNLHLFLFSMYNDGRDAFLPLIKADDELKVIGTALFNYDKYVDSIDLEESFVLRLLTTRGKGGSQQYMVTIDGEELYITIEEITSFYRWGLIKNGEIPNFKYNVKIRGEITDVSERVNLDKTSFTNELEEKVQDQLTDTAIRLVKRFQELGIDPIGLGEKYRSRTRNWNAKKWQELYKSAQVDFDFNIEIVHSGAIE